MKHLLRMISAAARRQKGIILKMRLNARHRETHTDDDKLFSEKL